VVVVGMDGKVLIEWNQGCYNLYYSWTTEIESGTNMVTDEVREKAAPDYRN
jgi:hypothetical protein